MSINAIAFDLDGTIYFGERAASGAVDTVKYFQEKGLKVIFFTNNSACTRQQIYLKLLGMGFALDISDVYTSGYVCAWYAKESGLTRVFCIGSPELRQELQNQGLLLTENNSMAEALVIGLDKQFDYQKLAAAMNVWKSGVRAIACNIDRSYPIEGGYLMPGCGAIVGALESAVGKKVDYIVGKPNTLMMELAAKQLGLKHDSIIVVGDNVESDIEMARRLGSLSILINNESALEDELVKTIKTLPELKEVIQI